jgi:acyl carrier protein phosphodiesterase
LNFLAHLFLSKHSNELMIGNFIADAVKGKQHENFPPEIQRGIIMHRAIDFFTDHHETARKTALRFRPRFGKYAPVLVDVIYDHFLAANWKNQHPQPLEDFTRDVYALLEKNHQYLPEKTAHLFKYMAQQNWLLSYAKIDGIERALQGMSRRTNPPTTLYLAISELEEQYDEIKMEWEIFFEDAKIEFSKYIP